MVSQKPTEYVVEWENMTRANRLATEQGRAVEDLDPADVFLDDDRETLSAAESFARSLRQRKDVGFIRIRHRVDIVDNGFEDSGRWVPGWEWDEETVTDDI